MRIVHLIPTLKKGGAERFALDVAIAQRALAVTEDVLLLVMGNQDEYSDYSHEANLRFIDSRYLPSITGRSVVEIENFRRTILDFRPDVIHTHLFRAELLSSAWLYEPALYVTHCHDSMEEFRRLSLAGLSKRAITNYYERWILVRRKYRRAKPYFVANSDDTFDYFKKMLPGELRERVVLIPYGFRFARFFQDGRSPRSGARRGPLVLTMVASFHWEKKNQEFLLEVAARLKKRGVSFQLNLVGDGPRRAFLEQRAAASGVASQVRFWGLVGNVEEVLWQTDVYVHSATYEPFGLVFLEAMAAGLPCVALDGRGNRRLIRDGVNGFMVAAPAADLFADRVLEVVREPARYARMSRAAIAMASDYDIAKCAETLVSFYRSKMPQSESGASSGRPHQGD